MLPIDSNTDVLEVEPAMENLTQELPVDCVTFEQFKNDYFRILKQRYETV